MNEVINSSSVEEYENKTIDLMLQEIYVKQAEKSVKNFEDAIKKLTSKSVTEGSNNKNNLSCINIDTQTHCICHKNENFR